MATLSDFTLRRRIDWGELISDWRKPLSIQPASVEVRLDENIIVYRHGDENVTISENGYELLPGEFYSRVHPGKGQRARRPSGQGGRQIVVGAPRNSRPRVRGIH